MELDGTGTMHVVYRTETEVRAKWRIANGIYKLFEENYVFQSPNFEHNDAVFCLRIYPFGDFPEAELEGWISVNVVRVSPTDREQRFTYRIKRFNDMAFGATNRSVFNHEKNEIGFKRFSKRSEFFAQEKSYAPNGVFYMVCEIKIHEDLQDALFEPLMQNQEIYGMDRENPFFGNIGRHERADPDVMGNRRNALGDPLFGDIGRHVEADLGVPGIGHNRWNVLDDPLFRDIGRQVEAALEVPGVQRNRWNVLDDPLLRDIERQVEADLEVPGVRRNRRNILDDPHFGDIGRPVEADPLFGDIGRPVEAELEVPGVLRNRWNIPDDNDRGMFHHLGAGFDFDFFGPWGNNALGDNFLRPANPVRPANRPGPEPLRPNRRVRPIVHGINMPGFRILRPLGDGLP